jgi:hypothetical protein
MVEVILIFYFIVFFGLLFCILFFLFKKGIIHFKLLKELFPSQVRNVNSYFELMLWLPNYFNLNIKNIIWISIPIYINIFNYEFNDEALNYHKRLVQNNKKLGIVILIYIFWVLGVSYLMNLVFNG